MSSRARFGPVRVSISFAARTRSEMKAAVDVIANLSWRDAPSQSTPSPYLSSLGNSRAGSPQASTLKLVKLLQEMNPMPRPVPLLYRGAMMSSVSRMISACRRMPPDAPGGLGSNVPAGQSRVREQIFFRVAREFLHPLAGGDKRIYSEPFTGPSVRRSLDIPLRSHPSCLATPASMSATRQLHDRCSGTNPMRYFRASRQNQS